MTALTAVVWAEFRYRQSARHNDRLERQLGDVKHKVGADRRQTDQHGNA